MSLACSHSSTSAVDEPVDWQPRSAAEEAAASGQTEAERIASFRTPAQCVQWAAQGLEREPDEAFDKLQKCSLRRDFDTFSTLIRGRWLELIQSKGTQGLRVLLRSVARRGEIRADLGSLRAAGFGLRPLDEARAGHLVATVSVLPGNAAKANQLVELGYVPAKYARAGGVSRITTFRYDAYGRLSGASIRYHDGRRESDAGLSETGNLVRLEPSPKCPVRQGTPFIVVGRLQRRYTDEASAQDVSVLQPVLCVDLGQ